MSPPVYIVNSKATRSSAWVDPRPRHTQKYKKKKNVAREDITAL